jgi:prephenate dehydratase
MTKKLAYLGPPGTYSEQAAINYDHEADHVACAGIPAVVSSVGEGLADEAVVPIENSLEGAVTFTLDLLIHHSDLKIKGELVIPIDCNLLVDGDMKLEDIEAVYSHPQPFGQCRLYLMNNLPGAEHVASLSTAGAVADMRNSSVPAAAISGRRAAEIYEAKILVPNIEDVPNNQTRFVVLADEDHPRTGHDKTSFCFDFRSDSPGILYETLGELAQRGINLVKIESRPDRRSLGRYVFLIDLEGHRDDAHVQAALEGVRSRASMFKILGSYPMAVDSSTN